MRRILSSLVLLLFSFGFDSARAADVKRFELVKGIHYYQIGEGVAYLQTNNMYRFSAQIYATEVGEILGASVINPRAQRIDLLPDNDGDPFRFRDRFDDAFGLSINFPNGAYQLLLNTAHDGNRTMNFNINGDSYPPAPVLNNYNAAQSLTYNRYNEISWQPFAGGEMSDFIQIQIEDAAGNNVWESPDFGEAGALNGLDTRVIMPPGALKPGAIYVGTSRFVNVLQSFTREYPGARGTVGYFTRTEFRVAAVSTGLARTLERVELWKTLRSGQLADGAPTPNLRPLEFLAEADALDADRVTAIKLTPPGGQPVTLTNKNLIEFDFSDNTLLSLAAFNERYSEGSYTFDITNADGSNRRAVVNLPAEDFPPTPNLQNLGVFPNHLATQDLTVSWTPWVGSTAADFIRVELSDVDAGKKVWDTPNYTNPKHLRSNVSTVTIPSTNLVAGRNYRLEVHFYRVNITDDNAVPGALVFGGLDSLTRFEFSTQPSDVTSFHIAEGQVFWQRGTNSYEADPIGPFRFEANVTAATELSVRSAQLTIPQNASVQLAPDETGTNFTFFAAEGLASSLAEHFPAGDYAMQFDTVNDGVRNVALTLPSTVLPPLPYVRNFQSLYSRPATADFDITWLKWEGANTNTDTIRFILQDASRIIIDSATDADHPLTATSTNVTIFGDDQREVAANRSYLARLRFERTIRSESAAYPGPRGSATVYSEVSFYISTLNRTQPFTQTATFNRAAGEVRLQVTNPTLVGRTYAVYETRDLNSWTLLKKEKITGSTLLSFVPPAGSHAFYKIVLLP